MMDSSVFRVQVKHAHQAGRKDAETGADRYDEFRRKNGALSFAYAQGKNDRLIEMDEEEVDPVLLRARQLYKDICGPECWEDIDLGLYDKSNDIGHFIAGIEAGMEMAK